MAQQHVIGTVKLQVRAARQADGFAMQQEFSRWFWAEFVPVLDEMLTEFAPEDTLIRLDTLDIKLPALAPGRWQQDLSVALAAALRSALERHIRYPGPTEAAAQERVPLIQNQFAAWLYFLEHGRLPLYQANSPEAERLLVVLEKIATETRSVVAFQQLLRRDQAALQRLVWQHDASFLGQLAVAMAGNNAKGLPAAQKTLSGLLNTEPLIELVKTILPPETRPVVSRLSPRQLEASFWQEAFSILATESQNFDAQAFIFNFFQRAFQSVFQLSFTQFLQNIVASTIEIQSGNSPLQRLSEILAHTTAGEAVLGKVLQQVVSAETIMQPGKTKSATSPDPIEGKEGSTKEKKRDITKPPPPIKEKTGGADSALPTHTAENQAASKDLTSTDQTPKNRPGESPVPHLLYVPYAGMVLLHPFLTRLFEATGLTENGVLIPTDAAHSRAVQLLYYLAAGTAEVPEYDVVLPKLLCGLALDTPIERHNLLTDTDRQEAETLLQAAIRHWGALGQASSDSLREGFLQRDGKLLRRDDGWLLQVESKTIDILMNRLPWGIGFVKLPWMNEILHVEWH